MNKSIIAGIGSYVPKTVYTNHDLAKFIDTSDEWIKERTGIHERRYVISGEETSTTMGAKASLIAIERAGINKEDIDFIIFATLSPDYHFPGNGVLLQRELGITNTEIGALDIRNQCSGFVYGLSIADQYIKTGMYKNILLVGSEIHSAGMDFSTQGRSVSVIFGDGAGAAIIQATNEENRGILSTHLHADGSFAEELACTNPGTHGGYYEENRTKFGFPKKNTPGDTFVTNQMLNDGLLYPYMDGQLVFKKAVTKFPEVINEALKQNELVSTDIDMFIPHQANLRISKFVQKLLKLSDDNVFNNIQKYGNTTAASIPIALCEAWELNKIKKGDLVCLAAFGSGFTWASTLMKW